MESDKEKFGERVGKVAELVGGQAELSRRTGISKVTIGSYISGNSEPSRERLIAMANAAEVSLVWLAIGEGPMMLKDTLLERKAGSTAPKGSHVADHAAFDALGVVEGMGLLTRIYSSGDATFIRAINANLMAFSDAVENKAKAGIMADNIQQIQEEMAQMRAQVNELNTKVVRLHNENNELKRELRTKGCNNEPGVATG